VVKQFEEETNLRCTIVLDVSRSMDWSGSPGRLTKLAYAERLAAALALLFLRQRDAVGLLRFDDAVRTVLPPKSRMAQWKRIVAALEDEGAGRASKAPEALAAAGRLVPRRGMIVLISDLLLETPQVLDVVRTLRSAGHQVTVLHIVDPAERELPFAHDAVFVDPESGEEVPASVAEVRAAYRATVRDALEEWHRALASVGATHEVVATDSPFGVPLRRAFAARQRLP
jgi:uncharacterized protein (DUF58 family)